MNGKFIFTFLLILLFVSAQAQLVKNKKIKIFFNSHDRIKEFKTIHQPVYRANDTIIIVKDLLIAQKDSQYIERSIRKTDTGTLISDREVHRVIYDTLVLNQDTLSTRREIILESVRRFTEKDRLISKALRKLVVFEERQNPTKTVQVQKVDEKPGPSIDGKIVRKISITVLNPIGPGMTNNDKKLYRFIGKAGNLLHVNTREQIVKNRLQFTEGKKINTLMVTESERLLRQTNNIYDAKIIAHTAEKGDSVDVLVVVQDTWSLQAEAGYDPGSTNTNVTLKDVNFLGIGHQFTSSLRLDPVLPKGYNYKGDYYVNNIYKTLSTAYVLYHYEQGVPSYGAGINRDFVTPSVKWGGGAGYYWDTPHTSIATSNQDYWLGFSHNYNSNDWRRSDRLIISGRFVDTRYTNRPPEDTLYNIYNNRLYLVSVGYLNREYYKDSYIFGLGRTEDIPKGTVYSATLGKEESGYGVRNYVGVNAAWGIYSYPGYVYFNAGAGGFNKNSRWEEAVITGKLLYVSQLYYYRKFKWRNFLALRYTHGFNQRPGVLTDISGGNGLRGLNSSLLRGDQKFVMNYEVDVFPPFNFLAFKIAFSAFIDMGWVSTNNLLITERNFFPGYGLGLRFQNEHLTFGVVSFVFAFYPNADRIQMNPVEYYQRNSIFYNFNNINYARPTILPYN